MFRYVILLLAIASARGEPEVRREYVPTALEKQIFHVEGGEKGIYLLKFLKLLKLIKREDWADAEPLMADSEGGHGRKSYSFIVKNVDQVEMITLTGPSSTIKNGEPLIDRIEVSRKDRNVIIGLDRGRYIIEWISAPTIDRDHGDDPKQEKDASEKP